jgi:hypothetical protein
MPLVTVVSSTGFRPHKSIFTAKLEPPRQSCWLSIFQRHRPLR